MSEFQLTLTNTAGLSSVISFWAFVIANALLRWRKNILTIAKGIMAIGFISLTVAIIIRGIEAERFPLANLYESLLWFAWAIMGFYLILTKYYKIGGLGWLASLTATAMFFYGGWLLPANQHEITPLVPALVSYWRQIHVPPLIISYAMFVMSGLASLLQLWFAGRKRAVFTLVVTIILALTAIILGTKSSIETAYLQMLFVGSCLMGILLAWSYLKQITEGIQNTKLANTYGEASVRCIIVGFPLLTFGIITGALWANHAWGTYWSWDPKESMALVTWLSYAAYLHLSLNHNFPDITPEKLSVVSVLGLLLTLLTYLGFNALGFGGLHSYGRFK